MSTTTGLLNQVVNQSPGRLQRMLSMLRHPSLIVGAARTSPKITLSVVLGCLIVAGLVAWLVYRYVTGGWRGQMAIVTEPYYGSDDDD